MTLVGQSDKRTPRALVRDRVAVLQRARSAATRRTAVALLFLACCSGGLGWLASRHHSPLLAASVCAFAVAIATYVVSPGVLIGLLVLGAENGLPGIDTSTTTIGGLALSNFILVGLAVVLALVARTSRGRTPGTRTVTWLAMTLILWWLITLLRAPPAGVPISAAATFGRDFLAFALLAPLCVIGLRSPKVANAALATVTVGVLMYSFGQAAIVASGASVTWLVHPIAVRTSDVSLQRVYAFMSDAVVLVFSIGFARALLDESRRRRLAAGAVCSVCATAIILQQTRAIYLTLPLAIVVVALAWFAMSPHSRSRLGRHTVAGLVTAALAVGLFALLAPSLTATYGAKPLSRLGTVYQEFQSSQGNVGVRLDDTTALAHVLGARPESWVTGLGFLDPRYHYVSSLPDGTIRNKDLGLLDGIALIGIVGVALVYGIVLVALRHALRVARRWRPWEDERAWLVFGVSIWLVQVICASFTLATLFEVRGLVLTALAVGVALNACNPRVAGPGSGPS